MGALVLLLFWFGFCKLLEHLGPIIFVGLGYLFRFLFMCVGIALALAGRGLWWLIVRGVPLAWRGLCAGYLFAGIFWAEWGRQEAASASGGGGEEPQDATAARTDDPLETAAGLLGLPPGFGRDELSRAYKAAIRKAHPDAGGSAARAAAVNAARDLIMERMGWAARAT